MQETVILSAVRTPMGSLGGSLKNVQPEKLLETVFTAAIERAHLDANAIDEVIAGQTKQSTDAPNIARVAALMAKIPEEIPVPGAGKFSLQNAAQKEYRAEREEGHRKRKVKDRGPGPVLSCKGDPGQIQRPGPGRGQMAGGIPGDPL